MDAFAFHPYPETSATGPALAHPNGTSIGLADYPKLVSLLGAAFDGTAQRGSDAADPLRRVRDRDADPAGQGAALLRHRAGDDEAGRRGDAGGDATQAMQMTFCQPTVLGLMLFHVQDEPALSALAVGRVLRRRRAEDVARPRAPGGRQRPPRHRGHLSRPALDAEGGDLCGQAGQEGRERHADMLTRLLLHRLPRRPHPARHRRRARAEVDPLKGRPAPGRHRVTARAVALVNAGPASVASASFRSY